MPLIEIGDLTLDKDDGSKQERLFSAIREKIISGLWPRSGKLPSTRQLSQALSLSRNTVIEAYNQLVAEGYIESKPRSGFFVTVELPEHFLPANLSSISSDLPAQTFNMNTPFATGVPDLAKFPHEKWQKLIQRHASRLSIVGQNDIQGNIDLRSALTDYLASSRSVHCHPNRIIITSGAQQALSIALMATLQKSDAILMEQPGYSQMSKIISLLEFKFLQVQVKEYDGLDLTTVMNSQAKALYITPSNQYPMGTTLNIEDRLKLIEWSTCKKRWIIEDDYDSEFQFIHRPYPSLQGLAGQMERDQRIIYVGSLSKVMFNGLRLGYMVVPQSLVGKCRTLKNVFTGNSPAHTQAALADFILEGGLLRHIRKMRRLYKLKHQQMLNAIKHHMGDEIEIISQAAGLHITLKWHQGIDEVTWTERARRDGIIIRPLRFYEHFHNPNRNWNGVVLGYGNIAIKEIEEKIQRLAFLFYE